MRRWISCEMPDPKMWGEVITLIFAFQLTDGPSMTLNVRMVVSIAGPFVIETLSKNIMSHKKSRVKHARKDRNFAVDVLLLKYVYRLGLHWLFWLKFEYTF